MLGRLSLYIKALTALLCALVPCSSHAQPNPEYLIERPPKRLALVVANSDYDTQTKLPGALADGDTMSALLKELGFTVTDARNVTRAQFLANYLLPFVESVGEDDFVIFYFSGHGFNYGGESYLVPTQFPKEVPDNQIFTNAISVTSAQSLLSEKKPAFTLMFLDACRNIAQFIKRTGKDVTAIEKGLSEMRSAFDNFVIGFSSGPGTVSFGSSEAGKLSYYTSALAKFLPKEDMNLDTVRKEVDFEVKFETQNSQKPYSSISSATEVYLKQSEKLLSGERELWLATLSGAEANGQKRPVERFLARYSVSRFVSAARRWLEDKKKKKEEEEEVKEASVALSRVSPVAFEKAWDKAKEIMLTGAPPSRILLQRMEGPVAFTRNVVGTDAQIADLTYTDVAIDKVYSTVKNAPPTEVFGKHSEIVLTGPIGARSRPAGSAKMIALTRGSRLTVQGVETDNFGLPWMRLASSKKGRPVFVNISGSTKVRATDVGFPLREVEVGGVPNDLGGLSNAGVALNALKELRAAGRSIHWISVTTPASDRGSERELLGLRAGHLVYALEGAGVSRRRISLIENYPSNKSNDIRVRFFGD